MTRPVARLTTPAQMVASLPLVLGYTPSESLLVVCCHEPRGRMGLTMRFDLPPADLDGALASDVVARVRQQDATRVLIVVYTDEADGQRRARVDLVDALREQLADLTITEAALVRDGRFWSFLCDLPTCCPAEGTPIDTAEESSPVGLLRAESILGGRQVLPSREAMAAALAGPGDQPEAQQRCDQMAVLYLDAISTGGQEATTWVTLEAWRKVVERWRTPPAALDDREAAALAVSLVNVQVRDQLAATAAPDVEPLLGLLRELCRRTPAGYDAPVCTLFAWVTYCEGAGTEVTIALDRALSSDPDYTAAVLLNAMLNNQVAPQVLRDMTQLAAQSGR